MPANQVASSAVQRPITEQIEELKSKIALLEGDRNAYYENSSYTIKKNREKIGHLRKENNELRKQLSDKLAADDHVINKAFENKPVERAAMSNKTGPEAVVTMDHKVCDTKKKLNALKNVTARKMRRLEELRTQTAQMEKDEADAKATDAGESQEAQRLRDLENKLDKAKLKCNEAEHIKRTYDNIKANMLKDQENYENVLCATEAEIVRCRAELKELNCMNDDAEISKTKAQEELSREEEKVYSDRKKREIELQQMKKKADEKKLQFERTEKRNAQHSSLQQEDLSGADKSHASGQDRQQKITTYEEAFIRIKEATGVSDTQEVVLRFESQGDITRRLEEMKRETEKSIARLREQKEKLQAEFEEMKYSGEAKLSSGQRVLEESEQYYEAEFARKEDAATRLDQNSELLVSVKAGVEHLSDKLQHLKANKGDVPQAKLSPDSSEYVLDLLSVCEEKLLKLLDDLGGKDLDATLKRLEEEEFHSNIEGRLPTYNTRVALPKTQRDNVYDDEEESGDDDSEMLTRNALKRQAQQLIDSKTKRRTTRKKKKTK